MARHKCKFSSRIYYIYPENLPPALFAKWADFRTRYNLTDAECKIMQEASATPPATRTGDYDYSLIAANASQIQGQKIIRPPTEIPDPIIRDGVLPDFNLSRKETGSVGGLGIKKKSFKRKSKGKKKSKGRKK